MLHKPAERPGRRHRLAQRIEHLLELVTGVAAEGVVAHCQRLGLALQLSRLLGLLRNGQFMLDADGRIAQLASGGVHNVGLGYFNTDTVRSLTDNAYPALNAGFGYDAADRLASVSRSGDAQGFGWDKTGNRTAQSRRASSYLSPPSCSHRLNISSSRGRCDDAVAFRVEGDRCDVRPVACVA